jgi:hypothetical protein
MEKIKDQTIPAFISTILFLGLGMTLLEFGLIGYGVSFFVFLPFVLGIMLGSSFFKKMSQLGLIAAFVFFISFLLMNELEGMICVLMSMPIVLAAMAIGAVIKSAYDKAKKKEDDRNNLKISLVPLALFTLLSIAEKQLTENNQAIVEVRSEILLPYSPMQVYETIKSVDTLDAEKPFLMKLDLPIPQKCILEEEKVGGLRTCYFEGGTITERITELEPGKLMRMDVIDYQLTGRKWLGFKEAIYRFDEHADGTTLMTRITTYTSELYPRFYWEPLEIMGIEQEHEYVFNNLRNDLQKKYGY